MLCKSNEGSSCWAISSNKQYQTHWCRPIPPYSNWLQILLGKLSPPPPPYLKVYLVKGHWLFRSGSNALYYRVEATPPTHTKPATIRAQQVWQVAEAPRAGLTCFLFCPSGLFLLLGLILYPAGWGCQKAIDCGRYASPYKPGDCSLGWAFYTATGGTVLTFICAVFSAQAEIATSSDKVQEEIEEGKNLICLL